MKRISILGILFAFTFLFTGCLSDGDETISLEMPKDEDNRIDNVVPPDIQEQLDDYIPIYRGVDPPNITGTYLVDPLTTVYCEDYPNGGGFAPGKVVNSLVIRFTNQNTKTNAIDYDSYNAKDPNNYAEGNGAFVSGSGNNFTAYFNTEGHSNGIYNKTALVISGTMTSNGIKDLHYAFIMVKKGSDPGNSLMDEGVYRVFKDGDGLSVPTTWNRSNAPGTRSSSMETPWTENLNCKSNVSEKQ